MAGGFNVGTVYGDVKLETSGFKRSVSTINKGQTDMASKSKKTTSAFAGMWKQMAVGMGVTTLVTSAIRGMSRQFSDTIQKGIEFGREWANVTTMLSITQRETKNLRGALIDMSPTLGDVTSLAKGMYQVLSASIEPAKAIEFLGVAAKAAKAGISEINVAVDALTTIINAYGMEAEEATNVSDIMFQTVKRGKLTFSELAQSLGTVAPVAGTIGVKFEEVAAAIASLTRQGIPAATATMQLRQVFMSIIKPSDDALKTAKKLGIEWSTSALRAKGLGGFLLELKEKTQGNESAMASLVPNVRALTGVMALAGRASEGFKTDLLLMADASGMANEAFEKQMKTAGFWVDTYKAQITKMKVVFFEAFVDNFALAVENVEEFDFKLRAMTIQAEMAGKISGGFFKTIWGGIKTVVNATTAQGNYNKMMKLSAEETVRMEERQKVVNKVIGKVKGIFDRAKGGVKGFLEELSIYKKKSEEISRVTVTLGETAVKTYSGIIVQTSMWRTKLVDVLDVLEKAPAYFHELGITAVPVGRNLMEVFNKMPAVIENVGKEVEKTGTKIKIDWESVADDMGRVWAEGFQGMMDGTKTFADFLNSSFDTVASGISSSLGKGLTSVLGIVGNMAGPIGAIFTGIISGALGMFKNLLNIKSKAEKEAEEAAAAAAQAQRQFDAQMEEAKSVMSAYGEITDATAEKIVNLRKTMDGYTAISLTFNDVIRDVGINQENINGLWERATSIMDQMVSGEIDATDATKVLDDAFSQLVDAAKEFGTEGSAAMVEFIIKAREAGIEIASVTEYILKQLNRIPDALLKMVDFIPSVGKSIADLEAELEAQNLELEKLEKGTDEYKELKKAIDATMAAIQLQNKNIVVNTDNVERMGRLAVLTFQSMLAEGMSWNEAIAAMGPTLVNLRDKYKEFGIEASDALLELMRIADITALNKDLFDSIEANRIVMDSFTNAGLMTEDVFADFVDQAMADFERLRILFGNDEAALAAMGPTFQIIANQADKFGGVIDDNTARILQQAKDMGAVTEAQEDEQAQQERLFGELGDRMAEIMQKLIDSIEGGFARMWPEAFAGAENEAGDARRGIEREFRGLEFDVPVNYKMGDVPSGPEGARGGPRGSFQGGVAFIPSGPTPITVHSRELVDITPLSELSSTGHSRAGLEMSGKGGGNNYNVTINGPLFAPVGFSRADIEESAEIFFDVLEREAGRVG